MTCFGPIKSDEAVPTRCRSQSSICHHLMAMNILLFIRRKIEQKGNTAGTLLEERHDCEVEKQTYNLLVPAIDCQISQS